MKILVTGGTGFIGGHLCERLAHDGHTVRALVRRPERADLLKSWGVEVIQGDLCDPASLERAVEGVEQVYHLGAAFRKDVTRRQIWDVNVEGTKRLLTAAARAGVKRLVHASTVGVHGGRLNEVPITERTPYAPIPGDLYQQSKIEAERVVFGFQQGPGPEVTVVQLVGVYGPRDDRFLRLIRLIQRRRFVMVGSGNHPIPMIHVDDLIEGVVRCGRSPGAAGNAYILSNDEALTLNRIVHTIAQALGVPVPRWRVPFAPVYAASALCEWVCKPLGIHPPLFRRRVNFFRWSKRLDIAKARSELGFAPQVPFQEGIQRTIAWYRAEGKL